MNIKKWLKEHNLSSRWAECLHTDGETFYLKDFSSHVGSKQYVDSDKANKLAKFLKLSEELFNFG